MQSSDYANWIAIQIKIYWDLHCIWMVTVWWWSEPHIRCRHSDPWSMEWLELEVDSHKWTLHPHLWSMWYNYCRNPKGHVCAQGILHDKQVNHRCCTDMWSWGMGHCIIGFGMAIHTLLFNWNLLFAALSSCKWPAACKWPTARRYNLLLLPFWDTIRGRFLSSRMFLKNNA